MSLQKRRGILQDIWCAYCHAPMSCRLRVVIRYLSCPFKSLLSEFPLNGRILDVGCGDGLLLYLLNREPNPSTRECVGIDVAENKISNARKLGIDSIEFHQMDISDVPSESFDCVSITDVLYLLPISSWAGFLRECIRALRKDGLLIVKETVDRPRVKFLIAYMQELLSIYVTRMTKGDHPHLESDEVYQESIRAAGAEVFQTKRIDAGLPYPHVLFLARKR
jgi:2-polyprenyl-3-methyl-5-hydroxy-6-metoxy-1,4-benzoquinol methylase